MPLPADLPHDDRGPRTMATLWVLTVMSFLPLGLRIFCKMWRQRGHWRDDYFVIASWVKQAV